MRNRRKVAEYLQLIVAVLGVYESSFWTVRPSAARCAGRLPPQHASTFEALKEARSSRNPDR
jgi:hypothetical protein